MLPVAAEQLVRALARKDGAHLFRSKTREREEPERREVGKRLVEMPDQLCEVDVAVLLRQFELVVLGAEGLTDEPRVGDFVVLA